MFIFLYLYTITQFKTGFLPGHKAINAVPWVKIRHIGTTQNCGIFIRKKFGRMGNQTPGFLAVVQSTNHQTKSQTGSLVANT